MSHTREVHRRAAAGEGAIDIAVVTVSDSRNEETDVNGRYLRERIADAGHHLIGYRIIPDDPAAVLAALHEMAEERRARIILFNGGTGVSRRDTTFDAISTRLEKTLPGFGELFRMLSWREVGSSAMLSRATAGVYRNSVVFSTPGSPAAVRLAWEELIEPEMRHLAWELGR